MQKLVIIILNVFNFFTGYSQWYDPDKVNPKAAELYTQGINSIQANDFPRAVKFIKAAFAVDPKLVDGYLTLGGIYASQKNYSESVRQYNKAYELDSSYAKNYLLPYSISLAGDGQFHKALSVVNHFLSIPTLNDRSIQAGLFRKRCYEFAVQYDKEHPIKNYVFAPKNLGDSVNSTDLEYFPSLTIDGKKMIFTRRVKGNEDFYESNLIDGKWSKATRLEGNINSTAYNEGAQNISQDGKLLFFTGCNFPEGLGSCDLYMSYLTKLGWSEPENLGPNVNSQSWESSPSLSPDKKDLYFSSNVGGTRGGMDIWVCHKNEKGKWDPPQNLGNVINTTGDESCPFIHADNQTLYFNSTGHQGYSEKPDLFVTRKQPDGTWSTPENLGYPINTIDDEGSLIVSADGKTAYYASDRTDTKGGLDIYTFELREDIRPLKTLWVKGHVYDKRNNNSLPSTIQLTNLMTKQVVSKLQTDEAGNYLVTLPVGKNYAFNVARKGYLFYSEHFDLSGKSPDSTYQVDIGLQPLEVSASIVLKNVFFDSKKTELKPESISELDNVVRLLSENPNLKIQISGHTDNVGKPTDNLVLSNGRALAVVQYLLHKGIKPERLSSKGFGESKPVSTNLTEVGKALNRRTELSVVSL